MADYTDAQKQALLAALSSQGGPRATQDPGMSAYAAPSALPPAGPPSPPPPPIPAGQPNMSPEPPEEPRSPSFVDTVLPTWVPRTSSDWSDVKAGAKSAGKGLVGVMRPQWMPPEVRQPQSFENTHGSLKPEDEAALAKEQSASAWDDAVGVQQTGAKPGAPQAAPGSGGPAAPEFRWNVSPEARDAEGDAMAAERSAVDLDKTVAQGNADALSKMYKRHGLEFAAQGLDEKLHENRRESKADAFWQGLQDEQERFSKMEINPEHFWSTKNTGQKALLLIGQAIANFGAGFSGHPELVNRQLDTLINQDIGAQKANIAKAHGALEAKRGLYAEMLRKFGDERQAEAAAKQIMIDRLGQEAQALAAANGGETAKAKAALATAQLDEKHADWMAHAMGRPPAVGGGGGEKGLKEALEDAKWLADKTEKAQGATDAVQGALGDLNTPSGQDAAGKTFAWTKNVPLLGHLINDESTYSSNTKYQAAVAALAGELGRENPANVQMWTEMGNSAQTPEGRKRFLQNGQRILQQHIRAYRGGVSPSGAMLYDAQSEVNAPPAPKQGPTILPPGPIRK